MKKTLIGTSWKMNKTYSEAMEYCQILAEQLTSAAGTNIQPFVIPPFTLVRQVTEQLKQQRLDCLTGVQNMHYAESGPWTGEISALMVKDCGATLVELGHSERRHFFAENDGDINLKVQATFRHQLRPLICIGDTAQEKNWGVSCESVIRQMKIALFGLDDQQLQQVIIAYEPVWAIGEAGTPATAEEAQAVHHALRQALISRYGKLLAKQITLLYGGSVNHGNAASLIQCPDIDGLFVGRAAWNGEDFCQLLRIISAQLPQKE